MLLHHSLLVVPSLAAPYFGEPVGGGAGVLVYTPLHVIWAGTEAVYLFFVLSGLVLALSANSRSFHWSSYFPSRIVRLYLPVIGAVILGAVVIALTPAAQPDDSLWVRRRPGDYDLPGLVTDALLVAGTSGRITPLWSLQWEILFSLLLPLYIYAARRIHAGVQIATYLALSTLGAYAGVFSLKFLPMFGIGVALATAWDGLSDRISKLRPRTAAVAWTLALLVAVLMVTADWTTRSFLPSGPGRLLMLPVILVGVCVIIVAAAHAPLVTRLLSSPPFAFLGLISFSLYLVHEPIVVAIEWLIPTPAFVVFVAVPVCIAVAAGFWYVIERPSHRLARRMKARTDEKLRLAV